MYTNTHKKSHLKWFLLKIIRQLGNRICKIDILSLFLLIVSSLGVLGVRVSHVIGVCSIPAIYSQPLLIFYSETDSETTMWRSKGKQKRVKGQVGQIRTGPLTTGTSLPRPQATWLRRAITWQQPLCNPRRDILQCCLLSPTQISAPQLMVSPPSGHIFLLQLLPVWRLTFSCPHRHAQKCVWLIP